MDDLIRRQTAIDALKICDANYDGTNCGKCPLRDDRWNGAWCNDVTDCYTELMRDTAKLLETLSAQPEQRWIPCSERLPQQGQEVICQCRANIIKVLKLDANGDWYQDAEHCYMGGFVIAWMPLPEPYQERGEQE